MKYTIGMGIIFLITGQVLALNALSAEYRLVVHGYGDSRVLYFAKQRASDDAAKQCEKLTGSNQVNRLTDFVVNQYPADNGVDYYAAQADFGCLSPKFEDPS